MNFYNKTVDEALDQNEFNEEKWKNYKENVNETRENVNTFLKSCKLDIMVPMGKKAFIRGTLQHTNDILVSHSSNYFSVVSNYQANDILKNRNETCTKRLKELEKERELFRAKLDIPKNDAFSENEIIEEYDEEAEKLWNQKHRESVKKFKMQEAEERKVNSSNEIDDLLDKYELMEEMAGELENLEENEDFDYESLLKMISGETKAPESNNRVSYEAQKEDVGLEGSLEMVTESEELQNSVKKSVTRVYSEHSIAPNMKPVGSVISDTSKNSSSTKPTTNPNTSSTQIPTKSVTFDQLAPNCAPEETKRKVRFSTSLEDVKIIENKYQEPETASKAFPPIQIKFHHSSEKLNLEIFNEVDSDVKFKHPGEIGEFLNTLKPTRRSILKETNYKYEKNNDAPKINEINNDDEELYESLSKFPLICGDVVERKAEANTIPTVSDVKSGKKVSKFKELRNKIR